MGFIPWNGNDQPYGKCPVMKGFKIGMPELF